MSVQVTRSDLKRVVVAIDPAVTSGEDSDETGIIVVARGPHQPETCQLQVCPGHGYVLDDLSTRCTPHEWARIAVQAYDRWDADRLVAEVNNGGDMVGETIHAVRAGIPYTPVRATRGKLTRAEPASALYEQGRVHHLSPNLSKLEDQLTTWTPDSGESPDRLDALVWGLTALQLIGGQGQAFKEVWKRETKTSSPEEAAKLRAVMRRSARQQPGCTKHVWGPAFGDGSRYCQTCNAPFSDRPATPTAA